MSHPPRTSLVAFFLFFCNRGAAGLPVQFVYQMEIRTRVDSGRVFLANKRLQAFRACL